MILKCLTKILGSTRRGVHGLAIFSDANVKEFVGKKTKVQGWVRAIRKMKDNVFIDINDGSMSQHVQIVLKKSMKPDNLTYGCSVSITGQISSSPLNEKIEIIADEIDVIGDCNYELGYPFYPKKSYSQEYIRQYLHLRSRTKIFSSTLRIRDLATSAINNHMKNRGFINVHTPIITSNDCEGAGEVFKVIPENQEYLKTMKKNESQNYDKAFFNAKSYLTVSGQFHLETLARSLSKVYTFGPIFRAENSKTRLHLSEFYMVEAEIAFINKIEQLTNEAELLIKHVTNEIFTNGTNDIATLGVNPPSWLNEKFLYLTYNEAIDILEKNIDKLTINVKRGDNLSKEHELFLVNYCKNIPVFIINWPKEIKPFYMKECQDDTTKVDAMDLLAPDVGELFGGSLREDNYDKLKSKIPSDIEWYLELRKWGNVPTGGFGMGFERYLQTVLGIPNIKDVIPFPRWAHNCSL